MVSGFFCPFSEGERKDLDIPGEGRYHTLKRESACSGRGEGAHMEALAVKFGILAGLFGILGLIGLAALLGSVIWLIIRVANLDSILPALICVLLSIGLTAGGLLLSPTPEVRMEPLKMPWEMVLERICKLKDGAPEDDKSAEDKAADAADTSSPEQGAGGQENAPAEGAEPAS